MSTKKSKPKNPAKSGNPAIRSQAPKKPKVSPSGPKPRPKDDEEVTAEEAYADWNPTHIPELRRQPEPVKVDLDEEKLPLWMAAVLIAGFLGVGGGVFWGLWGGPGNPVDPLAVVVGVMAAFGTTALLSWLFSFMVQGGRSDESFGIKKIALIVVVLLVALTFILSNFSGTFNLGGESNQSSSSVAP